MQKYACVADISTKVVKGYFFMFTGLLLLLMSFSFNRLVLRVYRSLIFGPQVLFLELDVRRPAAFPDAPLIT